MYSGNGTDLAEGEWISLPNYGASFAFLNENVGFLCAGELSYGTDGHFNVLRTTDGGHSWQRLDMRELEASLPGGVWNKPHACGAIGVDTQFLPDGILNMDTPGSIALTARNMGSEERPLLILYSQDWGENWDWEYRNYEQRRQNQTSAGRGAGDHEGAVGGG